MFLMLKKDWPGNFRRTVRDATGKPTHIIEWSPGDIIEMRTDEEKAAVKGDVGRMLIEKQPPVTATEPTSGLTGDASPNPKRKR